jgi:hypothetical protein
VERLEGNRRWVVLTVVGSSTWSLGHPHCCWVVRTVAESSALSLGCLHRYWVVHTIIGYCRWVAHTAMELSASLLGPCLIVASDVGTLFETSPLVLKRWHWGRDIAVDFEMLSLGSRICRQFRDVDTGHSLINGSSKEKEVGVDAPWEPPMFPFVQFCP